MKKLIFALVQSGDLSGIAVSLGLNLSPFLLGPKPHSPTGDGRVLANLGRNRRMKELEAAMQSS